MQAVKLIWAVLGLGLIAASSTYAHEWSITYGGIDRDAAYSMQRTSDGGYIVAGFTRSFDTGNYNYWVIKLNGSGDVSWQKTYDCGGSRDQAHSIQQTSDGGYIVAGFGLCGAGGYDYWVLKLDNNGNVTWQKTYGGTSEDTAYSIQQTSDEGYIVAGYTSSFGAGGYDYWVLKLDSSGDVLWQKTYGGSQFDRTRTIQQTTDGGYILAGRSESFGCELWVLKLDSSGDVLWQKTYGEIIEPPRHVQQTTDGGYVMAYTASNGGTFDYWVLRLDSSGDVLWQKTYGSVSRDERAESIQETTDGYIVGGYFEVAGPLGYFWILNLDSSGNIIWHKAYEGLTSGGYRNHFIQQTPDGGYVAVGNNATFGAGNSDYWVLKLDNSGNILGCDMLVPSNVIVSETSVVGQDTAVTPQNTSAVISNTTMSPQEHLRVYH